MKSKTSFFNTAIFKKNITRYWPIWGLYLCYLLISMPVNLWSGIRYSYYYEEIGRQDLRPYLIMDDVLRSGLSPIPVFIFSAVVALAVFSYLYTARNANVMHALPVNRFELYTTNYLSGLLFLLLPEVIIFVVSVLVCVANQVTSIQYLFLWLIYIAGMTFFAYSLAVFVAMFTGNIFAMPIYYFILNYLYVGGLYIISTIVGLLSYGVPDNWHPGASCILSPIYYLLNNFRSGGTYDEVSGNINGIEISGGYLIGIYAAAAVVLLAAAYQLYKRRQIETAGDLISIRIVKPVFRWGIALFGGFLLSLWTISILDIREYQNISSFGGVLVCIVIFGFLCFFIAEMLLQKSFRVFKKKKIVEWCGFAVATVVFLNLLHLDAFGVERYLPNEDEIAKAFVNMDYPIEISEEEIPVLLDLHRQVIEDKKEYMANAVGESGYYYTTFRYLLKDGTIIERNYPLPLLEEYKKDKSSPTGKILEWEHESDRLRRQILGVDSENNDYYSVSIDLYTDSGKRNNYIMSTDEQNAVLAAIEKDIEEGNFNNYYLYSVAPKDVEAYYNGISLDYYNKNGLYDNWTYYYQYRWTGQNEYKSGVSNTSSASSYITFGPDCTNLIQTLKELGIVNDTWQLNLESEHRQ